MEEETSFNRLDALESERQQEMLRLSQQIGVQDPELTGPTPTQSQEYVSPGRRMNAFDYLVATLLELPTTSPERQDGQE